MGGPSAIGGLAGALGDFSMLTNPKGLISRSAVSRSLMAKQAHRRRCACFMKKTRRHQTRVTFPDLRALVLTYTRFGLPSTRMRTFCTFTPHLRFVFRLEWLTWLPVCPFFPAEEARRAPTPPPPAPQRHHPTRP